MSVRRIAAPALIAGLMIAGLSASALADSATLSVTGRVAPTTELTVVDPTQTLRAAGTACTFVEGSITVRTNLQVSLTVAVDGAAAGDARLVLRTTEPAPGTPCIEGTPLGITAIGLDGTIAPTAGTTRSIWVAATTPGTIPDLAVMVVEDH